MLARLWLEKQRIAEALESLISAEGVEKARRDHHARRPPRPCGITIHTGIGCSYGCLYCYVPDMGFPMRPRRYPLSPHEMAYALAVNPHVLPGRTLAAYGSVTEPFLAETRSDAVSYIREVRGWLGLPSQVSTKAIMDSELVSELASAEPGLSVLVSVSALGEEARRLEPGAPPAEDRIKAAGEAVRRGLRVTLFLRPIIPGVTERHARKILELAAEHGIREVVLGTMRVTPGILRRLSRLGLAEIIAGRLPRKPRSGRDQVTIRGGDLKKRIGELARDLGIKVYPAACTANIVAHNEYCNACNMGPCGDPSRRPYSSNPVDEAMELLEAMDGYKGKVSLRGETLEVRLSSGDSRVVRSLLESGLRLRVRVTMGRNSRKRELQ